MRIRKHSAAALTVLLGLALFAAFPAAAQTVTLDLGKAASGSATGRMLQIIALMTVITLAPSILVMVTSFTRIIIVLSFVRSALGLQQTPPNQVLVSLALFLTLFIMQPVFEESWQNGVQPLIDGKMTEQEAFDRGAAPFHDFMMKHVRHNDLQLFVNMSGEKFDTPDDVPFRVLVPAFMIGEMKRAFEIGFLIFIPFVVIDMLVASILMAMGMMMLPPVTISLPFKLVFFVLVDGWHLVCGSLVKSFGV